MQKILDIFGNVRITSPLHESCFKRDPSPNKPGELDMLDQNSKEHVLNDPFRKNEVGFDLNCPKKKGIKHTPEPRVGESSIFAIRWRPPRLAYIIIIVCGVGAGGVRGCPGGSKHCSPGTTANGGPRGTPFNETLP